MRAIPLSLLPDTLAVQVPVEGGYGGEYTDVGCIGHVRFDSAEKLLNGAISQSSGKEGTVYIDYVNSTDAFELRPGYRVRVNGGEWKTVGSVETLKDFNGNIHHWEVKLK